MRAHLVDIPAVTPPYDHALAAGLARAGADVTLFTSRSPFGLTAPDGEGYRVEDAFHRRSSASQLGRRHRVLKLAEAPAGLLRYRRRAREADVVHYQWLGMEEISSRLLPPARPRVFTAHDVLPREPRRGHAAAFRRLMARMDAVVAHSENGATRLRAELGIEADRVRVIPHGAFEHLTRLPDEQPLPAELAKVRDPVVLFFGFVSPYKGVDVLLDAFASVDVVSELWVVGTPRVDVAGLEARARRAPGRVRFVPRFVPDRELPAYFRRADLVVLPYREIDQSGVLYTALAFGKPIVLTRVGGFTELVERYGLAIAVPPDDPERLAGAITGLLGDSAARARLAERAAAAAGGEFSWDEVARRTLALYEDLLG